jgi:hypothetical protein
MKRKIFSKLLMGAFLFASVSAFVSCKDYDDDINANKAQIQAVQDQLTTLTSNLNSLKADLQNQKSALEQELATAKSQLETQIATAKAELNSAIEKKADQSTVDALATRVANLETNLAALKAAYEAKMEAVDSALASLQAVIDKKADITYVDNAIAILNSAIEGKVAKDDFGAFKGEVNNLKNDLNNLSALVDTKADKKDIDHAVENINAKLAELVEQMKTTVPQSDIANIQKTIEALQNSVNALTQAVTAKAEQSAVDQLNAFYKELKEQVNTLVTPEQLAAALVALETEIAQKGAEESARLEGVIDTVKKGLEATIDANKEAAAKALADEVEKINKALGTKASIDDLKKAVKDFNDAKDAIVSDIATKYAAVTGDITKANKRIDDLKTALEAEINKKLDEATFNTFKKEYADFQGTTKKGINDNLIAIQALQTQTAAIEKFLYDSKEGGLAKALETLKNQMSADAKAKVDAEASARATAISDVTTKIGNVKTDLTSLESKLYNAETGDITNLKAEFATIDSKIQNGIDENLSALVAYIDRILKSIVLRPDTYYGGIEGVSVYTYVLPLEKNNPEKKNDMYHYFDRIGTTNISDYGEAQYHVNPSNVDLEGYSIDFYNWNSNLKEPAATERTTPTRSGVAGGIAPVYPTTKALLAADKDNLKDGILTVPFTADAAKIEENLKKGIATIASLSLEKGDTTVNSDYAIVVPEYGYGLLIGDNTFPVATRHLDQIGYDGGEVNSSNLHRSFSFLALATTSPTHTIKYDESFDITKVLESRYVPVKEDYDAEITDTAVYVSHNDHKAIAKWNGTTLNIAQDGDASIDKAKVVTMTDATFKKLGFKYEIQPVNYALGSNKTGETVHLELITNEAGHVIAYPRNVTAAGETIKGKTANAACVGRQPIVCIMVKDKNNNIVSFAYMKFLITQEVEEPEAKEINFDLRDIWVNCSDAKGEVTWSEIEYHVLDQALEGMSKNDFDLNYVFDYYAETTEEVDVEGATWSKVRRFGIQYDAKGGKRIDESKAFGSIDEEWNLSAQGVEDATTHIIKWQFTAAQLKAKAEELKNAGKLEDKGEWYSNTEPIATWVRYAHLAYTTADAPAKGSKPTKGNPSIWIKLTIPAGKLHVAKGDMGANKILTYWYDLNSKTNATGTDDAYEVRINVPVPVPEASATEKTIGYSILDNATKMNIRYDNLLEEANQEYIASKRSAYKYSEFTKNLKDFFIDGKLSATVLAPGYFGNIHGMKLGVEFITPSKTIGNASFDAAKDGTWTVKGYSGTTYTLKLNADRTKVQIVKRGNATITPIDIVTLNYDDNATAADRQITVLNYVNGIDQDDILNYKTHNELGERETFTVYLNIKAIDACAPVYWNNMWFNARILRPLDLEDPKQAVVPDAPNDWHEIDLTDALIVKDWREYYGDRKNTTKGEDVYRDIPGVGKVKAFDFAYYQVELDITEDVYYTDANLGTSQRSAEFTLGKMPRISNENDAKGKGFIKTASVPNLKLEKIGATKLRYLNNSGVTGGFHVFVPITMTYVYGYQTVRQYKWVTVGVTPSVEQAMIEE